MSTDKLITKEEAASALGVSSETITRWSREGKIDAVRIGRKVRYRESQVKAILDPETIKEMSR